MPLYSSSILVCAIIFVNLLSLTNEKQVANDHIGQVLEDLHQLLNQTDPITVDDIDCSLYQINSILAQEQDNVVFPGELLQLLKELGATVDLNGSLATTVVKDNIALLVADTTPANPILGMAVVAKDTDVFTKDSIKILDLTAAPDTMLAKEMVILLPTLVQQQTLRVSFIVFRDGRVFNNGPNIVNGRVVSIDIQNYVDYGLNEQISIYMETKADNMDNMNLKCANWHFVKDKTGYWSESECTFFFNQPQLDICRCNFQTHTYFARVFVPVVTTTPKITTTTTLSPPEQIQQVLDDIQQLLQNQTAPILVDDISGAIDQVNNILQLEQDDLEFPGALLQLIHELGAKVELNGSYTEAIIRDNIALLIADSTPENPVLGIALANRDTDTFKEDSFNLLSNINSSILSMNMSEAVISLPLSVTRYPRRIGFVVFRDARVFSGIHDLYSVNSRVFGINIENFVGPEEYEVVDVYLRPMIAEPNRNEISVCAFWNGLKDGTGYWSQEGCKFFKSSDPWMLNICQCEHLPQYLMEALIPDPRFKQHYDIILITISVICCLLSISAVITVALTAVFFESWRKNFRNQIWLQLCGVLFLSYICHLIMIFAWFSEYSVLCMVNGLLIYFCMLASYCWVLTASFKACSELYVSPERKPGFCAMLLAIGFSWGVPIIQILILGTSTSFMEPFDDMHTFSKFCKPSGSAVWLSFYTPSVIIIVIMVTNWVVSFFVIYKLDIAPSNRNEEITDRNRDTLAYARVSLGLMLLAGMPRWIFGFFAYNIVGIYLYTGTISSQGLVFFFFVVCGDKPTRNLWLQKFKRQCAITQSTRPPNVD